MKTKTPSKLVEEIIKNILLKRGVVVTLSELHFLVNKELKKKSVSYSISSNKLKKFVLNLTFVEVKTKRRRGKVGFILKKCPVCGGEIKEVMGKNVFGEKTHSGYKCKNCNYYTDLLAIIPREYIFVFKKK